MKDSVEKKKIFGGKLPAYIGSFLCLLWTLAILAFFATGSGNVAKSGQTADMDYQITKRYDLYMNRTISDALDGVLPVKKVYWLSDYDLVAPEPNQECFGETDDPASLQWLLDESKELMDGQETLFSTDLEISPKSKVYYYLDETIMVITWKQLVDGSMYTISEVKIADPSQLRRFMADGEYGSSKKYYTSEMAPAVNAVTALSGDYYAFRDMGIVVYNGQVYRTEGQRLDSCFIDTNGDMHFVYANEMNDPAAIEAYVKEKDIRFSLAFGPAMVDNGKLCDIPYYYRIGEIDTKNARAAFCQMGQLHYLLVTVNAEKPARRGQDVATFAKYLYEMGCINAYNLDGGQTATLVMNDKLISFTKERMISDIIYFATAIPDGA